jgi:hypothetical protein
MKDLSGGVGNTRTDENLNLRQAMEMTDYSDEEIDKIPDLKVGEVLLLTRDEDISIMRTA